MKHLNGHPRRRLLLTVLIILGFVAILPRPAGGGAEPSALILLSLKIKPYESLAEKLTGELDGFRTEVLSLDVDPQASRRITELSPDVVVCVGQEAFRQSMRHRDAVPIVYTMVLFPEQILADPPQDVRGVAMIPSPGRQLLVLNEGFHFRRVAVFFNPDVTGKLVSSFGRSVPKGMDWQPIPVKSDVELLRKLKQGLPDVDGVLLVPDPTVLSEQGLKALINRCYKEEVPIVGFSPMYLDLGAALSLSLNEEEIARQAVSIARKENGASADRIGNLYYPRPCEIRINSKAEERLGFSVDEKALVRFGTVRRSES